MDPEGESAVSLRHQNDQLRKENDYLKLTLDLLRVNHTLRSKLYSTDRSTDHGPPAAGKVSTVTWEDSLDDGLFTSDLLKAPYRTSSPLETSAHRTSSPLETSAHRKSSPLETSVGRKSSPLETSVGRKSSPLETSAHRKSTLKSARLDHDQQESDLLQVKDPERLVGEVAFQLDRRILGHVFQEQHRLYGYTVANIPDKITQVCTHPVSGKLDESQRGRLCERYRGLLERLGRFGYSAARHASFAEFLVNTYGILRQRPDPRDPAAPPPHHDDGGRYGNPELLRRLVVETIPSALLKDALLLLTCLRYLAEQDGKPLFLW